MKIWKVIFTEHGDAFYYPEMKVKFFRQAKDAEDFVISFLFDPIRNPLDNVRVEQVGLE